MASGIQKPVDGTWCPWIMLNHRHPARGAALPLRPTSSDSLQIARTRQIPTGLPPRMSHTWPSTWPGQARSTPWLFLLDCEVVRPRGRTGEPPGRVVATHGHAAGPRMSLQRSQPACLSGHFQEDKKQNFLCNQGYVFDPSILFHLAPI